jgi:hypothetical protein
LEEPRVLKEWFFAFMENYEAYDFSGECKGKTTTVIFNEICGDGAAEEGIVFVDD